VSCSSPSACTAAGYYFTAGGTQTLIESWNGSAWSIVPSPNASQINLLLGVSCSSSSACTAVGYYGSRQTLIERGTPSTTTSVLIPSSGATLSGSTYLDASASNATSVEFLLFGGIYGYSAPVICTATPTIYGWLCSWNTTTVPNGSYVLVSEASGGSGSAFSTGVSITVSNPPTTSVLIPSNGATLSGSTTLDASASNATSVEFLLFGGTYGYSAPVICTATPTVYGWLCSWNTTTVPNSSYVLVSEAFNSAGSTFSSGVSVTVDNVPLATQLLLPKNGSQISGTVTFDASAQGTDITGVYFVVTFGSLSDYDFLTATPTYYGWIGEWNSLACPPGYPNGSYAFQSVVTQAGGATAMSTPVDVTLNNTTGGCP
jgi:hypothetical protein